MSDCLANDTIPLANRIEGRLVRALRHVPGAWLLRAIGERPRVIDGLTLDPHVQFILAMQRRKASTLMSGLTPGEARRRNRLEIRAVTVGAGVAPTPVHTVRSLSVPGAAGALAARHYVPAPTLDATAAPLLVFFHGGGFVIGDLDTHDDACRMLCHFAGMHVLSVAYRLAPEYPFPAGLDDCHAAARWSLAHAAELGADPSRMCVGGDSAGANLAIGVAHAMAADQTPVAAQLLIYPATDFTSAGASKTLFKSGHILTVDDINEFEHLYLGRDQRLQSDPRVSPACSPALEASPPTYLVTCGFDPLRDEGEAYAAALQGSGVKTMLRREPALTHGFLHLTTIVSSARGAVIAMARRFRALVDDRASVERMS